jgi:1,2-diacylglycerol 3-beta-galactosyltransferase
MDASAEHSPSTAAAAGQDARAPRRVLILMSNTGGGHRASALALQAGFNQQAPGGFAVEIIDLLSDHTFWPLNKSPQIYAGIATKAPWLWGLAYSTEKTPTLARGGMRLAGRLAERQISDALQKVQPELVVSVHPLAQELTLHSLRRLPHRTPFATVVTDLATAHPLWLHPEVDACFVASDETQQQAVAAGLPAARIHNLGLPIRPAFADTPPDRQGLRARLEMDPALPAVLVMGGGDGVGPVEEIATQLDRALAADGAPGGQVVVICGRNEDLRSRLAGRSWQVPHHVLGFVDRMPDWMFACDTIVTKAGPGTMAEAFICGLPVILSGYIPGQEKGNVDYVRIHDAGVYEPEPAQIAALVARWFGPEAEMRARLAANARALGKPHATAQIVAALAALMDPPA